MSRTSSCFLASIALLVPTLAIAGVVPPPPPPDPVHTLVAQLNGDFSGLPAQDDPRFGFSVALEGDVLAVGAPGTLTSSGGNVLERGAVFIYRRQSSNDSWQFLQRIAFGTGGDGQCGHSVALTPSFLAVGCPFHEVSGIARGRAVVYSRNNSTGMYEDPTNFVAPAASAQCGYSVDLIHGDGTSISPLPMLAVGCPAQTFDAGGGLGSSTGAVHLFRWFINWDFAATVAPAASLGNNQARFGHSVALNRAGPSASLRLLLIAGIPAQALVRIYGANDAAAENWSEERTYAGMTGSRFGESVHMRVGRLIIGAPRRPVAIPGTNPPQQGPSGSITIATRSCNLQGQCNWTQDQNLTEIVAAALPSPTTTPQNRFGHAVHALTTNRLMAGEPWFPYQTLPGRARHYQLDGGTWTLHGDEPFYAPIGWPATSEFGSALAGDSEWLAVGAPGYPQANKGRVFVYAFDYDDTIFANGFQCGPSAPGCL